MTDIDALIEQATRREIALKGSQHGGWNAGGQYRGPRPDAQPTHTRPRLLWPDERRLIPDHCWHCGAGRANFETDAPYGDRKRGEVRCLVCSRLQVHLLDANTHSSADRSVPVVVPNPCVQCGERPRRDGRSICETCRNARNREKRRAEVTS